MDENKRQVLIEVGYEIKPTCGICQHGGFGPHDDWGTCRVHEYDHRKHTEVRRNLSIHRNGGCSLFQIDQIAESTLHGFAEFLPKPR